MKRLPILPFIYAIAIIVVGGGTYLAFLVNKPLNRGMSLQTNQATATSPSKISASSTTVSNPVTNTTTPTVIANSNANPTTPAIANLCGGSGSILVLVLGRDENYWLYPYGVDSIRLLRVNFDQKTIAMYSLPRDLLVKTPHLDKYKLTESNLGPAYYVVRSAEGNDRNADIIATGATAQIIYDNFGIKADHYMMVEESVLTDAINTVGGVEVNVPTAIDDDRAWHGSSSFCRGANYGWRNRTKICALPGRR